MKHSRSVGLALLSLSLLLSTGVDARENRKRHKTTKGCNSCITITRKDFCDKETKELTKTFVITQPGIYCFGESINFAPADALPAISVQASNVKINLCTKKLQQANEIFGVTGIELNAGYENIEIANGTICNFQGAAVDAFIDGREIVSSDTELTSNGSPAAGGTNLSSLDSNITPYTVGDKLIITGVDANGLPVDFELAVDENSSINTLIRYGINIAYPLSLGSITGGILSVASFGPADPTPEMALTIQDAPGNTGQTNWPTFSVTQEGNDAILDTVCFTDLIISDNGNPDNLGNTRRGTGISFQTPAAIQEPKLAELFAYRNITISNCKINRNALSATWFNLANGIRIENSELNDSFIETAAFSIVAGFATTNSANVQLLNSTFNNSRNESGTPFFVGGIVNINLQNLFVDTCQCNNARGINAFFVIGALGATSYGMHFENSQFNNPYGLNCGAVDCFHHSDSSVASFGSEYFHVNNCEFNGAFHGVGNPFLFGSATGIEFITIKDVFIENCQLSNHVNLEPSLSANGFVIEVFNSDPIFNEAASVRNITWRNCVVSNISSVGIARGINANLQDVSQNTDLLDYRNLIIENCILENVFAQQSSRGINIINSAPDRSFTNVILTGNTVSDVRAPDDIDRTGINLFGIINPILCKNIVTASGIGVLFSGDDAIGFSKEGLVQDNKVTNCTIAGYQDTLAPTESAWVNNTAVTNGSGISHTDNYNITWDTVNIPVDRGTLQQFPPNPNKYYNLSLTKENN